MLIDLRIVRMRDQDGSVSMKNNENNQSEIKLISRILFH